MDKILNLSAFGDVIPSKSDRTKEKTTGGDTYGYIFKMILQNTVQAKLLHWQCTFYGQHKALDKFFEKFIDLGDTLAESIMGKYGKPVLSEGNLSLELRNYEDPASGDLSKFMNHLMKCYSIDCKSLLDEKVDSELINIIEEISALVDQTKYLVSLR
jgi:DNA-binding ferritin-like protein